jgi:hypothetical protein
LATIEAAAIDAAPGVASDEGPLGHRQPGNDEGVDEHEVGERLERQDGRRASHGATRDGC